MSILSFFKKARPSLPRIDHPLFGHMVATLVNENGSLFWENPDPFTTPKGQVSVFLDGKDCGPSEEQVALWQWIYDNLERLTKAAEPLLIDRLRDFGLEDRIGDLVWTAVGLSPDGSRDGPWNISFELPAKHGAILTAYFENELPKAVSVDD
jgi:hypothetical protein